MTSRSWQYISCHWDTWSNHLAISDWLQVRLRTEVPRFKSNLGQKYHAFKYDLGQQKYHAFKYDLGQKYHAFKYDLEQKFQGAYDLPR